MALTVSNESKWLLSENNITESYQKTLLTAGTFIDRDIDISLNVKRGSVSVENANITATPVISNVVVDGYYKVTINSPTSKPIVCNFEEGWVSGVDSANITVTSGSLDIPATTLTAGLQESSSHLSGYSSYTTTASAGYSHKDLSIDLSVYQGDFNN